MTAVDAGPWARRSRERSSHSGVSTTSSSRIAIRSPVAVRKPRLNVSQAPNRSCGMTTRSTSGYSARTRSAVSSREALSTTTTWSKGRVCARSPSRFAHTSPALFQVLMTAVTRGACALLGPSPVRSSSAAVSLAKRPKPGPSSSTKASTRSTPGTSTSAAATRSASRGTLPERRRLAGVTGQGRLLLLRHARDVEQAVGQRGAVDAVGQHPQARTRATAAAAQAIEARAVIGVGLARGRRVQERSPLEGGVEPLHQAELRGERPVLEAEALDLHAQHGASGPRLLQARVTLASGQDQDAHGVSTRRMQGEGSPAAEDLVVGVGSHRQDLVREVVQGQQPGHPVHGGPPQEARRPVRGSASSSSCARRAACAPASGTSCGTVARWASRRAGWSRTSSKASDQAAGSRAGSSRTTSAPCRARAASAEQAHTGSPSARACPRPESSSRGSREGSAAR